MYHIALVEDIDEIRETLELVLDQVPDFSCKQTYKSSEAAIQSIPFKTTDLVLMDIGLPGMDGIKGMLKIKAIKPGIKFLMFTVFENDEMVFESLKMGADGYILKREPINAIIKAIREVSQNGAPMSKSIAVKVLRSFRDQNQKKENQLNLTERQNDILILLSKGLPYKLIADRLNITEGTVKQHIHKIYKKMHVNNRTEAINKYLSRNL